MTETLQKSASVVQNVDFFEAAKSIPDKSIPIILTSPPFKDEDVPKPYYEWYDDFMREVKRICSDYALIFNSSTRLNTIIRRYPVGKGKFKKNNRVSQSIEEDDDVGPFRILMWTKGVVQYTYRWQPIFIYRFTDEWNINSKIWSDNLPFTSVISSKNHPYEDPLDLYLMIIKMIRKHPPARAFTILDMFSGYGTAPEVCKRLKQPWLAFEIDSERCEAANRRLRGQMPLFLQERV